MLSISHSLICNILIDLFINLIIRKIIKNSKANTIGEDITITPLKYVREISELIIRLLIIKQSTEMILS